MMSVGPVRSVVILRSLRSGTALAVVDMGYPMKSTYAESAVAVGTSGQRRRLTVKLNTVAPSYAFVMTTDQWSVCLRL